MGKSPIPVADRFVQQSSIWKLIPEAGGTGCCGCWQRRTCCMSLFFYEYEFHLQQVSVLYVWSSPVSPPVTPFCSLPHGSSGVGRGSVGNVCLCCALGSFSWKWKQIEGSHTLSQIFYLWSSPQALAGITCLRSLSLLFLKGWLGSVGTWWVPCQVPEHCYGFKILTKSLLVSLGCLLPSKFRFLPTLCQGTGAEQSIPVLCPWAAASTQRWPRRRTSAGGVSLKALPGCGWKKYQHTGCQLETSRVAKLLRHSGNAAASRPFTRLVTH